MAHASKNERQTNKLWAEADKLKEKKRWLRTQRKEFKEKKTGGVGDSANKQLLAALHANNKNDQDAANSTCKAGSRADESDGVRTVTAELQVEHREHLKKHIVPLARKVVMSLTFARVRCFR